MRLASLGAERNVHGGQTRDAPSVFGQWVGGERASLFLFEDYCSYYSISFVLLTRSPPAPLKIKNAPRFALRAAIIQICKPDTHTLDQNWDVLPVERGGAESRPADREVRVALFECLRQLPCCFRSVGNSPHYGPFPDLRQVSENNPF